jgi:arylsulfatase A-like enzyme
MQWPGHLKAGVVNNQVISSLDLFPTAVALAGAESPKDRVIDGVNLMPFLTKQTKTSPHGVLCWRNGANGAVRKGNWKLFKSGDRYWLYDLSKDVGEQKDLAAANPEVVKQLKNEFAKWEEQMKQPMWPCRKTPGGNWMFEGVSLDPCI